MKKRIILLIPLFLLMTPNVKAAITGENYATSVQCGGFECVTPADYWKASYAGICVQWPVLVSGSPCYGNACYKYFTNSPLCSSNLRSWDVTIGDLEFWAYDIGDSTIEYYVNFSGNFTGGYWTVNLFDVETNASIEIDRVDSSDVLSVGWTKRVWINGVNSTVPYGYYGIQFYATESNLVYLDDVSLYDTPIPPIEYGPCRICEPSEYVEYVGRGLCLMTNLIVCNVRMLAFGIVLMLALTVFLAIKRVFGGG